MTDITSLVVGDNLLLTDQFFNLISDFSQLKCEQEEFDKVSCSPRTDLNRADFSLVLSGRVPVNGMPIVVTRTRTNQQGPLFVKGLAIALDPSNLHYLENLNKGLKARAAICRLDIMEESNGKEKVIVSCRVSVVVDLQSKLLGVKIACYWRYA